MSDKADLKNEIYQSLRQAGHLNVSRPNLRGAVGLQRLVGSPKINPDVPPSDLSGTLVVLSNPLRQGARFAAQLQKIVAQGTTVCDALRAEQGAFTVDYFFPSTSVNAVHKLKSLCSYYGIETPKVSISEHAIGMRNLLGSFLIRAQLMRYLCAEQFLLRNNFSTVLVDFDRAVYSRPFVYFAKRMGIPVATFVHGSPNQQNYVPLLADVALVWGEAQKRWYEERGGHAVVVGRPEFDPAVNLGKSDAIRRVVICHSCDKLTRFESDKLLDGIRKTKNHGVPVTLRLHPSVSTADQSWDAVASEVDSIESTKEPLTASVSRNDLIVTVQSTAVVDALTMGSPALVWADPEKELPSDIDAIRTHASHINIEEILENNGSSAFGKLKEVREHVVSYTGRESQDKISEALARLR